MAWEELAVDLKGVSSVTKYERNSLIKCKEDDKEEFKYGLVGMLSNKPLVLGMR